MDLPRFDAMYKPLSENMRRKIRGNAFSLYGLLDDIPELAEERFYIWITSIRDYDLYIVSDIWNNWHVFNQLSLLVPVEKIIVIDPGDTNRVFPFNNYRLLFTKEKARAFTRFKNIRYYKRELTGSIIDYTGLNSILNFAISAFIPNDIRPIQFAIPEDKISRITASEKEKLFTNNIVDEQVNQKLQDGHFIPLGKQVYSFSSETDYYNDIKKSKFGITSKRSGWDCLRHYEFAANGAVLCFKNLNDKPGLNAPHGLNESNCIVYNDFDDLMEKINSTDSAKYELLLANNYKWIYDHTTVKLAQYILDDK